MFKALKNLFAKPAASKSASQSARAEKTRRERVDDGIAALTQDYFYERTNLSTYSEEKKGELIGGLRQEVEEIRASANPIPLCREKLCSWVLELANYQVLSLTEEEKRDARYANCPYISGELYKHIQALSDHNKELKRIKWENGGMDNKALMSLCNAKSVFTLYHINCLNFVRWELGDRPLKDWFNGLLETALIWREDVYRTDAGLPSLLPDSLDALKYSTYLNFVLNGEENPRFTWEEKYAQGDQNAAYLPGQD